MKNLGSIILAEREQLAKESKNIGHQEEVYTKHN